MATQFGLRAIKVYFIQDLIDLPTDLHATVNPLVNQAAACWFLWGTVQASYGTLYDSRHRCQLRLCGLQIQMHLGCLAQA